MGDEERRTSDEHLQKMSNSIVELTTYYKVMTNAFSKLVEDNSKTHDTLYERTDLLRNDLTITRTNQKNHEKNHIISHQNKRDNKSTIAMAISALVAVMLFFKNILPWIKGH